MTKHFTHILFDLDGTLTDPAEGITNSVRYALAKYGISVANRSELYKCIGPPLYDSFTEFFGFSHAQALQAVAYYREYFSKTGIFENNLIAGIPQMLKTLQAAGIQLCLATSKPKVYADKILQHFDLMQYFSLTVGSNLDGTLNSKAEVIQAVLQSCKPDDLSAVAMVGDRSYDMLGALENKVIPIGVLFGYGSRTELQQAGAAHIAETVSALLNLLLH